MRVNTTAWTSNPAIVGHPAGLAILINFPKKAWTS